MTTSSSAAPRLRRALTGLGIVAASVLVLAPVAGAERPGAVAAAGGERSHEGPSMRTAAPAVQEAPQESGSGAQVESSGRHEQALCHRTGTTADPYVLITVTFHTADGQVVSSDGGHESHDGPVFDAATMDAGDRWGDIIPPFTTADGASYPGKNWPAGRATFENGCEPAAAAAPAEPVAPDVGGGEGPRPPSSADRRDDRSVTGEDRTDAEERRSGSEADDPVVRRQPDSRTQETASGASTATPGTGGVAGVTGDIAAVLGQQVTRDADGDMVVPASSTEPAVVAGLARTDTSFAVLLMLVLSALIGGYAAVDAIRERLRRTD